MLNIETVDLFLNEAPSVLRRFLFLLSLPLVFSSVCRSAPPTQEELTANHYELIFRLIVKMQDRMGVPETGGMPRPVFERFWREKAGLGPSELQALEKIATLFRPRILRLDEEANGIAKVRHAAVAAGLKPTGPSARLLELDREKKTLVLDLRWQLHTTVGLGKLTVLDQSFLSQYNSGSERTGLEK